MRSDLDILAARLCTEVVAPSADQVDREASFPARSIQALKDAGLLGALIPETFGGGGASLTEVARVTTALAKGCTSTAMIFAMHQIQVASIVRHGRSDFMAKLLREVVEHQFLLASATTEVGIGGDVRRSGCALERIGDSFRLEKEAPVISYGEFSDAILATARSSVDSPPNEQVLVVCRPPGLELEKVGEWDTLGFRGTCSNGFKLRAEGPSEAVLSDSYGDISSQTMLPVSHIVWGSVWLGLAKEAVDRARRYVQSQARKSPGAPPTSARRLAELYPVLSEMTGVVEGMVRRYEDHKDDREAMSTVSAAIAFNGMKLSTSTLVIEIVSKALAICGMAGYRNDSAYSLGRLLRDAHGAELMVNNDRILANNAQLVLVHRGE